MAVRQRRNVPPLRCAAIMVLRLGTALSFSPSRMLPVLSYRTYPSTSGTLSHGVLSSTAGEWQSVSGAPRWTAGRTSCGLRQRRQPRYVGGQRPVIPFSSWATRVDSGGQPSASCSMVAVGDILTVDYSLRLEDGSLYESNFDQGRVRLVAGGGGFAPFLHKAVLEMNSGEEKEVTIPPEDTFGEYDSTMTARLGIESAPEGMETGMTVQLWNGLKAKVAEITETDFKLDWNPMGAGTSLVMDVKVIDAVKGDTVLKKATFAGGCFWGLELAFQRATGVISTKAGYAQGFVKNPSYSDVCGGKTGHTEAVQVMYDPAETTYEDLLRIFFARHDPTQVNGQGNDKGPQYRAGVYYHDEEQQKSAEAFFAEQQSSRGLPKKLATELEAVREFFDAEVEHQQYLQKGGQDAKKEATETIRCYG